MKRGVKHGRMTIADSPPFLIDHLDAYRQEKWSSMVHNLSRMKAKDALLAFADKVEANMGSTIDGLQRYASDEMPNISNQKRVESQLVTWCRGEDARARLKSLAQKTSLQEASVFAIAPHDQHLGMAMMLRDDGLFCGLYFGSQASVDRSNTTKKASASWSKEETRALVDAFPDETMLVFGPKSEMLDGNNVSSEERTNRLLEAVQRTDTSTAVGVIIPRDDLLAANADPCGQAVAHLERFMPFFTHVLWTPENDHIGLGKVLKAQKDEQQQRQAAVKSGDKVRITTGMFSGQLGIVEAQAGSNKFKVKVGKMTVVVKTTEVIPL